MKLFLTIIFLFFLCKAGAQDLVPNGSFEDYKVCPIGVNNEMMGVYPNHWRSATEGNPDYFNKCCVSKGAVGVPENVCGSQNARTGVAYMGIVVHYFDNNNYRNREYREYIQVKLNDSLRKNEIYILRFFVSLADNSTCEVSKIGTFFSKEAVSEKNIYSKNATVLPFIPQIENDSNKFLSNDSEWTLITGLYKATGGEQYLTIGDFSTAGKNIIRKRERISHPTRKISSDWIYYYIDDVSLIKLSEKFNYSAADSAFILKNALFKKGESDLSLVAHKELDKLAEFLNDNWAVTIELSGEGDDTGKKEANLKLAEERAKAIADYLISKGIEKDRITCKSSKGEMHKQEKPKVKFNLKIKNT